MTTAVFVLNERGVGELLKSDDMAAAMERYGEAVQEHAQAIAHVDTGAFRDSIRVRVELSADGERIEVWVYSDDPGALAIEARDATLRTAVDAARSIN